MKQTNEEADTDEHVLRISMDAKATIKVGPFARGWKSRVLTKAVDHDFTPQATVTPVGILLPASEELFVYAVTSKVTSDCLVDRLANWWEADICVCTMCQIMFLSIGRGTCITLRPAVSRNAVQRRDHALLVYNEMSRKKPRITQANRNRSRRLGTLLIIILTKNAGESYYITGYRTDIVLESIVAGLVALNSIFIRRG